MNHDSDYCRRRAATERAAASQKGGGEALQIAGDLALAYSALARRRMVVTPDPDEAAEIQSVMIQD